MRKLCLNMIVKDEASIIKTCLKSCAPYIDYWVICDTGSTDGTQKVIKDFFDAEGIPGELHHHEWVNFAHNRNLAFEVAQAAQPEYLLLMDADDTISQYSEPLPELTADAYYVHLTLGTNTYYNTKIIKANLPWRWEGAVHEYIHTPFAKPVRLESKFSIIVASSGARSKDQHRFLRDAMLLSDELAAQPYNSRACFYLAQSYRDAGLMDAALRYYAKRVEMAGWAEEVYVALTEAANCKVHLGHQPHEVLDAYLAAYRFRPSRLEAPYLAVVYAQQHKLWATAATIIALVGTPAPSDDILFVESSIYSYKWDEICLQQPNSTL